MVYRRISKPLARFLSRFSVNPNLITIIATILGILAGFVIFYGRIYLGIVIIFVSQILDCTDGDLARLTGKVTTVGGYLDRVFDRFVDSAIIIGIIALNPGELWFAGVFAIVGSFGVSISRAMAEAYGIECKVGLGGRDTRIAIIMLGLFLREYLITLVIIAVLGFMTTLHRMFYSVRELRDH
jgi:CDP-diacylglycerol--glycerol-3-phosphate 3-phosphatidyltransferase